MLGRYHHPNLFRSLLLQTPSHILQERILCQLRFIQIVALLLIRVVVRFIAQLVRGKDPQHRLQ